MSDSFRMLVDVDASLDDVDRLSRAVLTHFREIGLISGAANPDCVLGGEGYRPGPALPNLYVLGEHEFPFWGAMGTNGVEPKVGRDFNVWALGPSCEGLTCPVCKANFEDCDDSFEGRLGEAIGEWYHRSGPGLLCCPRCGKTPSITEWHCKPPLGFGNLSFTFWNWPALDSPSWKIDITALVKEITGHNLVYTYGHF